MRIHILGLALICTSPAMAEAQSPHARDSVRGLFGDGSRAEAFTGEPAFSEAERSLLITIRGLAGIEGPPTPDMVAALYRSASQLVEAHPRWPDAWLALGLAKRGMAEARMREVVSTHQPAGAGWLAGAVAAFERSHALDPGSGRLAVEVADLLEILPPGRLTERANRLLQRSATGGLLDAAGHLALANAAVQSGNYAIADGHLRSYIDLGGDPALVDWLRTEGCYPESPREQCERLYYSAAGSAAAWKSVRANLALIATPGDLATLDGTPPPERAAALRKFWSDREVRDGRPSGSRLQEHFRRVRYARTHFAFRGTIRSMVDAPYREPPLGLDDQGAIYVRHGDPDERASYIGGGRKPPNESWAYFRPEGNLIFHFVRGLGGNRLLRTLQDLGPPLSEIYESRAGLGIEFLHLATRFSIEEERQRLGFDQPQVISSELLLNERLRTERMIAIGTTTDSDPIALHRAWQPVVQAFGIGPNHDAPGGLLVALALPAPRDLNPIPLPDGSNGYVVRLRTTAADDSGRVTLDADTVLRVRTARPLAEGEFLNLVLTHPVPAGDQRLRIVLTDSLGERGAIRIVPAIPIPDFGAPGHQVTDLIVGTENSPVGWRHPSGTILPLHPRNAWSPDEPLTVGFELGGLPAETPYRLRIAVADLHDGSERAPRVAVESQGIATGARELVTRTFALGALRPGTYLLSITVIAEGRTVTRDRRITIVPAPRR